MSQIRCRQLIESRLAQWAELNDIKVGYQKQTFTPPPIDKTDQYRHIRCFQLPARTGTEDLEGTHKVYRGVFAINVITPKGRGPAEAGAIVAQLEDLFPTNLLLTAADGFECNIVSPLTESAVIEGDVDDTTPTSFEYEARTSPS
ncbi:MAG TPA: phage tail terminator-like protein [Steroidobacter sp.]|uniref:phage tail terminator-like protein n=1 Tax=Steroidobacter sp. TaxID=1978227 RepID=UPI002EDBAAA4